ncbi:hypothetical protein Dsin_009089 [Dipteronia sinensis]|uniref:Helitron helicase-like domain-containing protein n=1 Tax=Dipteronia sinensis TaxID=43782 RepID=A0AAE0AR45_9ROSI|nr:hypothetical protein Dsin_009089 [Dipteronia sinensis]
MDEIERFQSARWISPPEAIWRIYGFILNEIYPSVITLQLHLEDRQIISFQKSDNLTHIMNNDFKSKTMLTEFFNINRNNDKAKKLLYKEFPEHFVWNKRDKIWIPRKQCQIIGRIVTTNPIEGERYYLRLLLNHIRGPKSFEDLKTVNGVKTSSFHESALLYGLLESDNSLEQCLQEASLYQMPYTLRRLFATILVYCKLNNPKMLWNKFEIFLSEDYNKMNTVLSNLTIKTLQSVNSTLELMGNNINDYHLVDYNIDLNEDEK